MRILLVVVAVVLAGCRDHPPAPKEQSFAEAVKIVCAAKDAPPVREASHRTKAEALSLHLEAHVTNPRMLALFKRMATMDPEEKQETWARAIAQAGVKPCTLWIQ